MLTLQKQNKTAIIYCRVSSKEQVDNYSLDNQEKICKEYAERNNIQILKIFREEGQSAKTTNREQLIKALAYCQKNRGLINYFLFYKIDRFSRDMADFTALEMQLFRINIEIKSASESFDNDTAAGKLSKNVLAVFAQYDNDARTERIKQGVKKGFESGKWFWSVPTGYLKVIEDNIKGEIKIDPIKSEKIKKIFIEFAKGIYTQNDMVELAKKLDLKTSKEVGFSNQSINKMLKKDFYLGILRSKHGEIRKPELAIISEKIFYRCQEILSARKLGERQKYKTKKIFALQHFAICGYCGRPLTARCGPNRHGKWYYHYCCYNKDCASKKSISKNILEDAFVDYLKQITPKEVFLKVFKKIICDVWQQEYKKINLTHNEFEAKLVKLKQEKLNIIQLASSGKISTDDLQDVLSDVKKRIMDTEIELNKTELKEFDIDKAVDFCFGYLKNIPTFWKDANYDTRVMIQSMIFPKGAIYNYEKFETLELSRIFSLNNQKTLIYKNESSLVVPRGIEPLLPG